MLSTDIYTCHHVIFRARFFGSQAGARVARGENLGVLVSDQITLGYQRGFANKTLKLHRVDTVQRHVMD